MCKKWYLIKVIMDKKKVEELIEKTIRFTKVTDDDYIQGNVKSHIINTLQVALKEISKSDWVSVEDELPPYDKVVWVTSKMSPDNVFKNRRVESTTVPKDDNDFIILWEGRMARITHWKPIDKLEDWYDKRKTYSEGLWVREKERKNHLKPNDFPEDMSESSTLDELVSEGDNMYDALKEALELIHDLAVELEYKDAVEG